MPDHWLEPSALSPGVLAQQHAAEFLEAGGRVVCDGSEIAERLAVTVSWVRESTRSGAMPCVELGRYRRYVRDDVEAWLEPCKQPGRAVSLRIARG